MKNIFQKEFDLAEIRSVAREIVKLLKVNKRACVLLNGELGAGKTTLVRELLREFGLAENVRVQSPTFMYLQEYVIANDIFLHFDLYRLESISNLSSLIDQENLDRAKVLFVEWPNRMTNLHAILPTHLIEIKHTAEEFKRDIVLSEFAT